MRFPTTQQFARLATLGVTDAERAMLAQRNADYAHVADLINTAARWPLGSGGLRHFRIFGDYPKGAQSLDQLEAADSGAITAWRHLHVLPVNLEAVFTSCSWRFLSVTTDIARELADIARAERVDAARNACIEQRIEEATVLFAGYVTAARQSGCLTGRDYAAYVGPVPEQLRRAGRAWAALGKRQRERHAAYRASLRQWVR
jgi:hypothetical protein